MICPVCYAHLHRLPARGLHERILKFFTQYRPYSCDECDWRGMLSAASFVSRQQLKQTLLGWALGIALALGIAWFMVGELQTQNIQPSGASAEIKLFGR